MFGGLCGELDARNVEIARRLHEKEAVGASELEQLAATTVAADEIDAAGKLAPQHRLGAEVIGVAIRAAPGEISCGVVGGWVEAGCLRAAEATFLALQNVAAVEVEPKRVARHAAARRAWPGEF